MARAEVGVFLCCDMDSGFREIGKPASMVGIGMGQDDVFHALPLDSEGVEPGYCRVVSVELKAGGLDQFTSQPALGIFYIKKTDPRINQHYIVAVVQDETVADHGWKARHEK